MLRTALVLLFALPAVAQDKPKPKAPPKISIAEPEKLKDDPDFAVQGEYVGGGGGGEASKTATAAQVVAQGNGKFAVKWYVGGLPGEGWDGKPPTVLKGERKGETVVLTAAKGDRSMPVGTIEGGKFVVPPTAQLKKIERTSPTAGMAPPEGATVLFAGPGTESNWAGGKLVELSDGKFLNNGIKSKQSFGTFKLHVEFRLPWMPDSTGQGRANSGVYLQDRYEVQVLDSFGLDGKNNECGGIYTQYAPKVNMCLPPMRWQTYDMTFTPAKFDGDKKVTPARLSVLHNGVAIHDNIELKGPTGGGQAEKDTAGPLQFQNHGNPVVFRNVWVVEAK
jgi:hypothetical protein